MLSENIYNLVHTVVNDLSVIKALNMRKKVFKRRSLLNKCSAELDVEGDYGQNGRDL